MFQGRHNSRSPQRDRPCLHPRTCAFKVTHDQSLRVKDVYQYELKKLIFIDLLFLISGLFLQVAASNPRSFSKVAAADSPATRE